MKRSRRGMRGVLLAAAVTMSMLTGCGDGNGITSSVKLETGDIQDTSVVIKVGDVGVKYSEVRNYCYMLKEQYEGNFGSKLWNYSLDKETTIGDEAKEEILNMITQLKVISATATSQKVSLTNDEKDEAIQRAEELMDSASEADKKKYSLSVASLQKIYEENALANKMFYIATDAADTEVTDAEAKQIKIAYILVKNSGKAGKAEKSRTLARAQEMLDNAKKSEDFVEFAKTNTEADSVELTIGQDSKEMDAEAITAAFALKKGEVSSVVRGTSGCYIIYCINDNDEDATYARKEQIIAQRQTSMFKKKYAKWMGDYSVDISKSFWRIFTI